MKWTFGQIVLSIYSYLDGCCMAYPDIKRLFEQKLVSYIESYDEPSRQFLELCVNNYEKIINKNFDFLSDNAE